MIERLNEKSEKKYAGNSWKVADPGYGSQRMRRHRVIHTRIFKILKSKPYRLWENRTNMNIDPKEKEEVVEELATEETSTEETNDAEGEGEGQDEAAD